ncbi:molecular chaperone DjiA, partial [Campylobacter sp. CH185]
MEERMDEFKRRMNYYIIALLAKIAKSDGRVSENEAEMIKDLLDANAKDEKERAFLKASFNEHKENLSDAFYV